MRVVDLFAGCGGLSKGFENAGFQLVGAFEFWNAAAECYRQNFNHPVFQLIYPKSVLLFKKYRL